jgi:hypothetical protein
MGARLKKLGLVLAALGVIFIAGAGFAVIKVNQGSDSLNAFAAEQNVTLSYNEDGQLVDRGETAGADAILAMLKDDWKYPVNMSELDPNDPLVNTGSEYMYQMATITFHTLHGSTTVTLPEGSDDAVYNGKTYSAGDTVEFKNDGRYWTGFDRSNPIEGAAREKIWTGTAHGLIGELGVGAVTASTLQLGLGVAAFMGGVGATLILAGLGLVWAAGATSVSEAKPAAKAKK